MSGEGRVFRDKCQVVEHPAESSIMQSSVSAIPETRRPIPDSRRPAPVHQDSLRVGVTAFQSLGSECKHLQMRRNLLMSRVSRD